jgi:hypothetical protein
MGERNGMTLGTWMRCLVIAVMLGTLVSALGEAMAAPVSGAADAATDVSAQTRRPPTRFRVYPGRLLYRDCTFRLAQQWRPSGPVIVPVQRCWWVRG